MSDASNFPLTSARPRLGGELDGGTSIPSLSTTRVLRVLRSILELVVRGSSFNTRYWLGRIHEGRYSSAAERHCCSIASGVIAWSCRRVRHATSLLESSATTATS